MKKSLFFTVLALIAAMLAFQNCGASAFKTFNAGESVNASTSVDEESQESNPNQPASPTTPVVLNSQLILPNANSIASRLFTYRNNRDSTNTALNYVFGSHSEALPTNWLGPYFSQ